MSSSRKPRPTFAAEFELWTAGYRVIAGVDEVGVGVAAGPLVAAALLVPFPQGDLDVSAALAALADVWWEVRDSKDIVDAKKMRLDSLIRQHVTFAIGMVDVAERANLADQNATCLATERALDALSQPLDAVLVDGDVDLPKRDILCRRISKAEGATTSLSISAGSIVANMYFNSIMRAYGEQYPGYGFAEHKGYLTPKHREALLLHGPCPIHHLNNREVRRIVAKRAAMNL